ncbi:DEAD/DEAH box helicase family protein [Eggerthella sinensis]|uniref:Restriction endonuclease subunit R n=1 Tax=Eggerthella sinensis TaxID=242230 RepID=A0A3N0J012_9ACTN|nr:DEAD/DEAH box helicase family protein [Eggerthella sinensis]RDB69445.1 restriction endonuclease subunit R [Eggerthella sinensis]RNM41922.1 restriction endonuclease subunit R [Eggerthella sinensis]
MEFKFKKQRYQEDAALAVVSVFQGQPKQDAFTYLRDKGKAVIRKGMEDMLYQAMLSDEGYTNAPVQLSATQLLDNIHRVQRANGISESSELSASQGACQLDIEMETGTGKTYVYTKTMYELNRTYGWTKFIIVVPGIAIREGVNKSLQNTEQHFFEQYGKKIESFIYDSDNLTELDRYSESPDICAMIINMQAFNTSMKEGTNNKQARIIFDERDEFGSRRPIDVIAANRPIIIQDEPQKMGGKATQNGIKQFNPLFCLNYSATHRVRHNTVYVLDALDAFNQRLVKRIEVKGFELKNIRGTHGYLYLRDIVVSRNKAPVALIEYRRLTAGGKVVIAHGRFGVGDDIYPASGEMEAYREGYQIAPDGIVPDQNGQLGYVRFLNEVVVNKGEVVGDSTEDDIRRIQIRETIKSHLQKESALFFRGIKCLSLFFIDEVAKYRNVANPDRDETIGYRKLFEEEYKAAVAEFLNGRIEDEYTAYLCGIGAHETNEGYFSIDKKGNPVESKKEKKAEREDGIGLNDDDARRAYDLILRDKERLLSFEEHVRFIFSHSALREGWDNPNIFQICTLKHSDNEVSKRQEVGRGLRLCVDTFGNRQDLEALGEGEVHRVNVLTVIASESYASFVDALQKDIKQGLRERPTIVTDALFAGKIIENPEGTTITLSNDDARKITYALIAGNFIDMDGRPTATFRSGGFIEYAMDKLPENLRPYVEHIGKIVQSVYDSHALDGYITDGHEQKIAINKLNANFHKKEFQELWAHINHKHAYTVSFDAEELRWKAIAHIDEKLFVSTLSYTLTTGSQKTQATRESITSREQFGNVKSETVELDALPGSSVTYDLVGEIAQGAAITRRSATSILKGISPLKFAMFKRNPEEFIAKVARAIVAEKATMIVDHIEYHTLEDTYDEGIFTEHMPENMSRVYEAVKNIQDYVVFDSAIEHDFAKDMDEAAEVCVYARLPRGFKIPTPVGDYAPDWAIAFNKGAVRHVFFIAETKGSMDTMQLDVVENSKIACAKKLFNEMSTEGVRYHQVATYDELLGLIGNME